MRSWTEGELLLGGMEGEKQPPVAGTGGGIILLGAGKGLAPSLALSQGASLPPWQQPSSGHPRALHREGN